MLPVADGDGAKPGYEADLGDPIELKAGARWGAGVAGGLLALVGSWALLTGTDGAGTVAIFIAALILLLLAVTGVVPQRIWAKDIGMMLNRARQKGREEGAEEVAEAAAEAVASVADEVPEDQTARQIFDQINSALVQMVGPYEAAAAVEATALERVEWALKRRGYEYTIRRPSDTSWDAEVSVDGRGRFNVEAKVRVVASDRERLRRQFLTSTEPVLFVIADRDSAMSMKREAGYWQHPAGLNVAVATLMPASVRQAVAYLVDTFPEESP